MKRLFELIPHVGAGDIRFGMTKKEVISILGEPENYSKKSVFEYEGEQIESPEQLGYFENELQITIDGERGVDFIEFYGKEREKTDVFFKNIDVFSNTATELISKISELTKEKYDSEHTELPYTVIFRNIDLSLWRQMISGDEGKYFWAIAIGKKGYYRK